MTTLKPAVSGDINDTRVFTLNGPQSNLDDVTAIEAHVWLLGGTPETLAASVTDSATKQVTVELGDGTGWLKTAAAGSYLFEIQATFGSTVLTWPQGSPSVLKVRTEGD